MVAIRDPMASLGVNDMGHNGLQDGITILDFFANDYSMGSEGIHLILCLMTQIQAYICLMDKIIGKIY